MGRSPVRATQELAPLTPASSSRSEPGSQLQFSAGVGVRSEPSPWQTAPPHPMVSSSRSFSRLRELPDVDMKTVWRLRHQNQSAVVLSNSQSATAKFAPSTTEFRSQSSMMNIRNKHTRSDSAPAHKFNYGSVTSHEVG